jgi:hypothetical protein
VADEQAGGDSHGTLTNSSRPSDSHEVFVPGNKAINEP